MRNSALLLACWLVGCAAVSETQQSTGCGWPPDPELHGAYLENDTSRAFTFDPDFKVRVRRTIEAAADYWGAPYDVLYGWRIHLVNHPVDCFGHKVQGCAHWSTLTIKLNVSTARAIEETPLVHEVGHLVLSGGDPGHWNSQWWDREALEATYRSIMPYCLVRVMPGFIEQARASGYDVADDGCVSAQYKDYYAP